MAGKLGRALNERDYTQMPY